MNGPVALRSAQAGDATDIANLYNRYVAETCITFETEPVAPAAMAGRIAQTQTAALPWLVAEAGGGVVGYAYASQWKGRCAYRYSVESTIYLACGYTGQGVGGRLYRALLDALRVAGMHAVIGGIALPNAASVALHERCGFRQVAHFEQVGFKHGRWIDVGYWQLLLDRPG